MSSKEFVFISKDISFYSVLSYINDRNKPR